MVLVGYWWQRHRWTLICIALAVALGAALGAVSDLVTTLPAPRGSRAEFYVELFFAAIGAAALLMLLLSRAQVGLPILLAGVAFLLSRGSMQWQISYYTIVTAIDVLVVLGFVVLMLHAKVLRKQRLRPLAMRAPLWAWLVVGLVGLVVALARGVLWVNWVPEVKGFYLWILIAVLCVNVIRSRVTLQYVMVVAVLFALPDVLSQVTSTGVSDSANAALLANGAVVYRTQAGSGLINQYAFYIMAAFFIALGLGMTSRRWLVRLFFFGSAAWLLVGIGLTYTRGAWIATAVGLLVLGVAGGRRVVAGLVAAGVLAYLLIPPLVWARLTFTDHSVAERVGYIQTATATIRAYPLLGGGWGSDFYLVGKQVAPIFDPGSLPWWHDDYLVVATQVGLPGLAVYLWIWAAVAWAALRARRRAPPGSLRTYVLVLLAAVAAMFTQAFTDNFAWHNETGPVIWLIFGLICAAVNLIGEEAPIDAPSRVGAGLLRRISAPPVAQEPLPR